ncbi:hypothetical protein [Clostridium prolinivorans]|uniref:hypothetical protein n=1 Tax=Clostridium prolinivorans TaxID=2769420 RepID=UPI000FD8CDA8|nr:hypothetical protein [Clostridium prolinivorans]
MVILGTSAYASGTVSIAIYKDKTGADSISQYCSSFVDGYGFNDKSSERALWYEIYRSVTGPDQRVDYLCSKMAPSTGTNTKFKQVINQEKVSAGNYYVHLDPDGALTKGCWGAGNLVD